MTLKQIQSFLTVVENGSITKAAQASFITPQSLIQQMNQLEDYVGCTLLERSSRGIKLTQAGEVFYKGAKEILEQINLLLQDTVAQSTQNKSLKIGQVQFGVQIPKLSSLFRKSFPEVEHTYVYLSRDTGDALHAVKDEKIDSVDWIYEPLIEELGLNFTVFAYRRFMCVMHPNHPLAHRETISFSDLNGYNIGVARKCWFKELEEVLKQEAPQARLVEASCEMGQLNNFCLTNNGIFLVADIDVKYLHPFVALHFEKEMYWPFGAVHRKKSFAALEKYIELEKDYYRAELETFKKSEEKC